VVPSHFWNILKRPWIDDWLTSLGSSDCGNETLTFKMLVNFEGGVPTMAARVSLGWKNPDEPPDCPAADIDETLVPPGGHFNSDIGILWYLSVVVLMGELRVSLLCVMASSANITLLLGVSTTLARRVSPFNTLCRVVRFKNGIPFFLRSCISALLFWSGTTATSVSPMLNTTDPPLYSISSFQLLKST